MDDTTTLGSYLRAERERRGMALRAISEQTKVSLPLLEGLESDDISRWPGGIFRRAFVRAYADSVGLDPDEVLKRFEQQHKPAADSAVPAMAIATNGAGDHPRFSRSPDSAPSSIPNRARYLGTAADLTIAAVLAFGSAAAGSRLLWPVLMIAAYYAVGVLLTGTSPMVALLSADSSAAPTRRPRAAVDSDDRNDSVDPLLDHSSAGSIS
jgi:transcriptional regulator with XRE-family HTH domain